MSPVVETCEIVCDMANALYTYVLNNLGTPRSERNAKDQELEGDGLVVGGDKPLYVCHITQTELS